MARRPSKKSSYDVGNTLLSASNIILVGFILKDLKLDTKGVNYPPTRDNANNFMGKMLTKDAGPNDGLDPGLARIYGFIASGRYVELDAPTIFLVHGPGEEIDNLAGQETSLVIQDYKFPHSGPNEAKGWSYDESDFSMTLDVSTGPIADLIEAGMGDAAAVSGSRVSGSRVSGSRVSGSRVSGSRVSGSRVSGSRVSGSRVSGSRVSGVDD